MQLYSQENEGYNYMLTVIDCFSRFAFAKKTLKIKSGDEVKNAFESILGIINIVFRFHTKLRHYWMTHQLRYLHPSAVIHFSFINFQISNMLITQNNDIFNTINF